MAASVARDRRGRPGHAPRRGAHGLRARGDERELLHGHRSPAAGHRGGDRVPPGHCARGGGHADTAKRRGACAGGRRRLRGHAGPARRHPARPRPGVRERRALCVLHRHRPPRGPEPGHRGRRRPGRSDAGGRRRRHAPGAGGRSGADRSGAPGGRDRSRRDVVGHPLHLRPARHGTPSATDLRPARLAPAGHRDGDRPRRARPGADAHRGGRSGPRRRRGGASPGTGGADNRGRCSGRRPRSSWS